SRTVKTVDAVMASGTGLSMERFFGPLVLSPGEAVNVTLAYRPTSSGETAGKVTVFVEDEAPTVIDVTESASGGKSEITAAGSSVDFGKVPVGTTATKDVTVTNTGSSEMKLENGSFADQSFSLNGGSAVTLAPGQTTTVAVEFKPSATGAHSGEAKINTAGG